MRFGRSCLNSRARSENHPLIRHNPGMKGNPLPHSGFSLVSTGNRRLAALFRLPGHRTYLPCLPQRTATLWVINF